MTGWDWSQKVFLGSMTRAKAEAEANARAENRNKDRSSVSHVSQCIPQFTIYMKSTQPRPLLPNDAHHLHLSANRSTCFSSLI